MSGLRNLVRRSTRVSEGEVVEISFIFIAYAIIMLSCFTPTLKGVLNVHNFVFFGLYDLFILKD
jgi:hypothetical protein